MILYLGNDQYAEFFTSVGADLSADASLEEAEKIIITEYSKKAVEAVSYAKANAVPVFAVLDGYKAVAEAFGMSVSPIECDEGEQEWAVIDATSPVYVRLESVIKVARGKAYAVTDADLTPEIDCMSRSEAGDIIALRNFVEPKKFGTIYALNYDLRSPLTPNGRIIAENFVTDQGE